MLRGMLLAILCVMPLAAAEAQTRQEWSAARRACARQMGLRVGNGQIYLQRNEQSVTLFECAERRIARRRARAA